MINDTQERFAACQSESERIAQKWRGKQMVHVFSSRGPCLNESNSGGWTSVLVNLGCQKSIEILETAVLLVVFLCPAHK
jgi:hypothetical protein